VRGAVERRYRLVEGAAAVDMQAARSMTLDDHRAGFTAAAAALIGDFHAYLDRAGADPIADEVSYRQYTVWLSPEERSRLIRDIWGPLRALLENGPGDGRDPYLLSTIFFPSSGPPARGEARPAPGGPSPPPALPGAPSR